MKKTTYAMIGLSLAMAPLSFAQQTPTATATTPSQQEVHQCFSYIVGQQLGNDLARELSELQISDIDAAMLMKGMEDGMANKVDPEMAKKDVRTIMNAFLAEMEARAAVKAEANAAAGKAFLAENAKKEGVKTTASGLQYKVLTPGTGATYDAKVNGTRGVALVSYEGRKIDGTVFDASSTPIEFPLTGVIPGFSEALQMMPIGSEWEIYIPSELAYQDRGPGIIGPNATLIFKLKLHGFAAPQGSQDNPIQLTPEQLEQLLQSSGQ